MSYEERVQWVLDNDKLALWYGHRYSGNNIPFDDIVQAARVGMLRAAQSWDPEKGKRSGFKTHCGMWAKAEVQKLVMEMRGPVRDPWSDWKRKQLGRPVLSKVTEDVMDYQRVTPSFEDAVLAGIDGEEVDLFPALTEVEALFEDAEPRDVEMLTATYLEERSEREVAERMGYKSRNSIRWHRDQGVKRLKALAGV